MTSECSDDDQNLVVDKILCYLTYHGVTESRDIQTYGLSKHRDDLEDILAGLVAIGWVDIDDDDHRNGYVNRRYCIGVVPQDNPGVVKGRGWLADDEAMRNRMDDCVIRVLQNCPRGTTIAKLIELLGDLVSWAEVCKSLDRLASIYSTRVPIKVNGKHVTLY